MLMHTAGRTSRSTGIFSVVHAPPKCAGASRCVPKCSSEEKLPMETPPCPVSLREKTFSPDQLGSLSESGWPRSRTRGASSPRTEAATKTVASNANRTRMIILRLDRSPLLPPGHGLHEEGERPCETLVARSVALEVTEPHHHEVVGRDDERRLAARAGHVIGLFRHGELPKAVDPEEAAVDGALVLLPGGRDGAHELRVALGQDALAVPDTVLQVQVAQPRPVAPRGELVALREEVPEGVR